MAEKHKSKYKAPKDLEKSQKPKARKDLKDYTHDDKKGALNPKSTGDAQLNVLRKRDKEMVDDGKLYVKYNEDDRLYKDIEDGDYDPKIAAKRLKKRQDTEEKETADVLKDKIENLTREGKERLVREYVRRKIVKILKEAEEEKTEEPTTEPTEADPSATETPTPEPSTATPTAAPTTDPFAAAMPTDAATPGTEAPPAAAPAPDTSTTTPGTEAPASSQERVISDAGTELSKEGNVGKIKLLNNMFDTAHQETDPSDMLTFYKFLKTFAIKKLNKISTAAKVSSTETDQEQE